MMQSNVLLYFFNALGADISLIFLFLNAMRMASFILDFTDEMQTSEGSPIFTVVRKALSYFGDYLKGKIN